MPVKIDKISPKLIASTPKAGGSAINSHQDITLFFDESVKSGTGSIVISNGKDIHKIAITDAQVKISNKTITINPIADLLPNSHYTVTVSATAIQDVVGNKFAGKLFTFDTVDTIAPVLKTTNPTNGRKLVSVNRDISFTFNEKIKLGDGNIILSNGTDVLKISVNDPQVSVSGTKLTFNPIHDFVSGSSYTVKLETNAVKDLAGNVFTGNGDGFKFYTKPEVIVDKTAPILTLTTPSDNTTGVFANANLKLVFNETIRAGAGDIIISNGTDIRTISIVDKSQVTISDKTITINLGADLWVGKNYNVQLSTGVILDKAGNTFAGITNATVLNFSTVEAIKPVLTSGKAIDGYLSGSNVFADENGDGIQNEGEASAKTDASGNFTLTNAKGTLHISGGTDLSTGKAFQGILKAPEGSTVITPFTTVQQGFIDAGQTVAQAEKSVATAFGFDADKVDLTKYDPIAELVKASVSGTSDTVATQMMASSAQIANFFVTTGQVLQGAAGNNISTQNAGDALLKSLVTSIQNDAKTGDGKINLADSTLLKAVIMDSAKEVNTNIEKIAKETGSTVAPKFDAANFVDKIDKMADTVSSVLKTASDNITAVVTNSKGDDALTLLSNMDKVSAFTQNDAGVSLQKLAADLDTKNIVTLDIALKGQADLFTGDNAKKSIETKVVETKQAVNDVIATAKAIADKAIADAAAKAIADKAIADAAAKAIADKAIADAAAKVIADKAAAAQKIIDDAAAKAKYDAEHPVIVPDSTPSYTPPADTTAPKLSSSTPADNATSVAIVSDIVLTFNEPVVAGTGNIVITNATDGTDTRTILVTDSQVSVSGNIVTINPAADLKAGDSYYVAVANGAIKDSAGNSFAGISGTTTLNFTVAANTVSGKTGSVVDPSATPLVTTSGKDVFTFPLDASNSVGTNALNVSITGFGTGDKLQFDTAATTVPTLQQLSNLALYGINDNGTNVTLTAISDGSSPSIQQIILVGLTGSRAALGGSIDSLVELNTFLGGSAIEII